MISDTMDFDLSSSLSGDVSSRGSNDKISLPNEFASTQAAIKKAPSIISSTKFKSIGNHSSMGRMSVGPTVVSPAISSFTVEKATTDLSKSNRTGMQDQRSIFKNISAASKFYSSKAVLIRSRLVAVATGSEKAGHDNSIHLGRPLANTYVACSYRVGITSPAVTQAHDAEHTSRQITSSKYFYQKKAVRPSAGLHSTFTGTMTRDSLSESLDASSTTLRKSSIHADVEGSNKSDHKSTDHSKLHNTALQNHEIPKARSLTETKIPLPDALPLPSYYLQHLKILYNYFVKLQARDDPAANYDREVLEHFKDSIQTLRQLSSDCLQHETDFLSKRMARAQASDKNISLLLPRSEKPLLVLDLDETLIHKPVQGKVYREEASAPLTKCLIEGRADLPPKYLTVYKRPYLQEFLQELAELYTIYVFTAADAAYASSIVSELDPDRQYISRVLDRRFCSLTKEGFVVKDLRIFTKEANLDKILLVDNSSHCFFTQLKNGVPILSFNGQKDDRELLHLKRYLQALSRCDNMLERNSAHFQLEKYLCSHTTTDVLDYMFSPSELAKSKISKLKSFRRTDAVAIITNSRSSSINKKNPRRFY